MQLLYTAENFNNVSPQDLQLVLALDEMGCGVAVHTTDGVLQLLGYYNFNEPVKVNESVFFDFLRSREELKKPFKSATVVLQGNKSTLVPAPLFDELFTDSYLRHIYAVDNEDIVKSVTVLQNEAVLVFAAKDYLFYPARSKYPDAGVEPHSAGYIRKSARAYQGRLNAFVENGQLYLVHCLNGKPVFFNGYPCASVEEAVYFILNYYQVFNTTYQQLPLLLHGDVHPQLLEILNTYMPPVEVAQLRNKVTGIPGDFNYHFLIDFHY
jgi:hypothetical protein